MSNPANLASGPAGATAPTPVVRRPSRRWKRNVAPIIALVVLLLLVTLAIVSPFLGLNPVKQDLMNIELPPLGGEGSSLQYPFGTDDLGRDLLARVAMGLRTSVLVAFAAVLIAAVVGIAVGVSAGYLRGRFDDFIMRIVDVQQSIPSLLLVITLVALLKPNTILIIFVLALSAWDVFARVARSQVLSLRESDLVLAITALGASPLRIVLFHVLPNIAGPLVLIASFEMATLIIAESSLSYLGFGVPPPEPSLGSIIAAGQVSLTAGIWWPVGVPSAALCMLIISINVLGDWARDRLDPRSSTSR